MIKNGTMAQKAAHNRKSDLCTFFVPKIGQDGTNGTPKRTPICTCFYLKISNFTC